MAAPVRLLRRMSLFAELDDDELAELAERCHERLFTRGSPVTTAGSRAAGFFVIADGEATVRRRGVVQRQLHGGDWFGELAVIDGGRRSADITADTDLRCFGLSQREFKTFVTCHPEVAWALLERVVGLLREATAEPPPAGRPARRFVRARASRRDA